MASSTKTTGILAALATAGLLALTACKAPATTNFTDLDYPFPVQHADVGGTSIAYAEMGHGERTIVLIHGLGSYMPVWKNNAPELATDYRVIAIDLPGYGKSDKPEASYSMKYFARQIHALLGELGVQDPVLVGHSMGGQIAMTYALLYPEEYGGLVLTSPAGFETFEDGEAKWLAQAVSPAFTCAADDESIYARHVGNFHRMPKDAHFMVEDRIALKGDPGFGAYCEAVSKSVAGMLDQPVYDDLPKIDQPVLVLFGKNDNLIPNPFLHGGSTVKVAKKGVDQLPNAELVVLEKAGHMAQFEVADEWNSAVRSFLSKLPAPGVSSTPAPEPAAEPEPEVAAEPEPAPDPEPEPVVESEPEPEPEAPAAEEAAAEAPPAP